MTTLFDIHPFQWLKQFLAIVCSGQWRTPWFQAAFCLFIMTTQFVAIEGWYGVSMVKVIYMCMTPLFMLSMARKIKTDVIGWVFIGYFGMVCFSAFIIKNGVFKTSSICYMFLFLLTYCYFMSLIYSGAFTYEFFLKFLRGMLLGYFYILILQQMTAVLHFTAPFSFLNCHGFIWGWKFPCMNLEPSHASRILIALFISFVELLRIRVKDARNLAYLWKNERKILIAFCYAELTNGGSTGMIAFIIAGLYLLFYSKRAAFFLGLAAFILLIYLVKDTVAFQRFLAVSQAAATLDENAVQKVDNSAAMRVNIFLGTIHTLRLSDLGFWVGYGFQSDVYGIGILIYYGMIAYALQLVFLFKYAFCRLLDIRLFIFMLFLWGTLGNVAHAWAIIMYWSAVKYFMIQEKNKCRSSVTYPQPDIAPVSPMSNASMDFCR